MGKAQGLSQSHFCCPTPHLHFCVLESTTMWDFYSFHISFRTVLSWHCKYHYQCYKAYLKNLYSIPWGRWIV
jgi:hypothetical protein